MLSLYKGYYLDFIFFSLKRVGSIELCYENTTVSTRDHVARVILIEEVPDLKSGTH